VTFITFYTAGFTVAQRERAQEDFNVPHEGASPHPTPFGYERQPQHRDHPTLFEFSTRKVSNFLTARFMGEYNLLTSGGG